MPTIRQAPMSAAQTMLESFPGAFRSKTGQHQCEGRSGQTFTPEQLSVSLLQKIERDADAFLGEPVEKAVVTVPACFDDSQRSATKDAAEIAGLEANCLVHEPTAAPLAYGFDRPQQELRIAVANLGSVAGPRSKVMNAERRDAKKP